MPHLPICPEWCLTVGHLIDERAEVRASCPRCGATRLADLRRIARVKGRDFSLWGRRARCDVEGCTGRVGFLASRPNARVWPTMLS